MFIQTCTEVKLVKGSEEEFTCSLTSSQLLVGLRSFTNLGTAPWSTQLFCVGMFHQQYWLTPIKPQTVQGGKNNNYWVSKDKKLKTFTYQKDEGNEKHTCNWCKPSLSKNSTMRGTTSALITSSIGGCPKPSECEKLVSYTKLTMDGKKN